MDEDRSVSGQGEAAWRRRFILVNLITIAATVLVLFSILLWQTDYIVEGGSVAGFPLALIGLVISFFAPRWLSRYWKQRDQR
jgi:hypothetical protein